MVAIDEINCMLGIPPCEILLVRMIHFLNDHFSVLPIPQGPLSPVIRALRMMLPHIIGIHQSAGFIKTTGMGPGLRLVSAVPFSKCRRGIARLLKNLSHGGKSSIQPPIIGTMSPENLGSTGIAATQQGRARS